MGRALGLAALRRGWRIVATRRRCEALRELEELGFEATCSNREAAERADVVVIAVKPWVVEEVAREIGEAVEGKPVASIAAGVPLSRLRSLLPRAGGVYRAMPNVGALVGLSATALVGSGAGRELVEEFFRCAGLVYWLPEERFPEWTVFSGSAPGLLAVLADAYLEACIASGLPRDACRMLAAAVFEATGRLLRGRHPAVLRDDVSTPGGITIAGVEALEERGARAALIEAFSRAVARAREAESWSRSS